MRNSITLFIVSFLFLNCAEKQSKKTITTIALKQLMDKQNIQLLDVRTPEEIKQGSIKTAMFINYYDDNFVAKASKVLDKEQKVYLYCRSGNRSGKSANLLEAKGYDVVNVLGGYVQWKKENKK
jgi:rhodanese-related sulfurtransferase